MILLQFMCAFPGVKCSVPDKGLGDLWEIAIVYGALPAGAREWAKAHNVVFFQRGPVMSMRWASVPHREVDMMKTIVNHAATSIEALDPSNSSTKAAISRLAAFETAAREARLLP